MSSSAQITEQYYYVYPQKDGVSLVVYALNSPATSPALIPISAETYQEFLELGGIKMVNNVPTAYTPEPPPTPSLQSQAQAALKEAGNSLYQNYGMYNEPTPQDWVTYLNGLKAIANGTDKGAISLPPQPTSTIAHS